MKTLILILLSILAGCHGYSYFIPASFRNPGICFYNGRILPKGDSQIPMVCQKTNCRDDGSIMVDGCGRITLPNCTLIESRSITKSYPECCQMSYHCIDANGNTYIKEWNQLNPTKSQANSNSDMNSLAPSDSISHMGHLERNRKTDYRLITHFLLQLLLFP